MMTKDKRIIALILIFVLLCVCFIGQPFVANADANSKKSLKFSAILTDESFYVDKNESYAGYTYEYLKKLEEYGNYDIDIVVCGTNTNESINKAFELVETGECDITGLVLKNDYTMEHYELVDVPYGTRYQVLAALSSDFSLTEENVLIQKPLKIGALETGKYARRLMTTYLDALGVEYEITPLKNFAELYDALEKKEVQVVLTNSLAPIKGTRIVEKYSGEPYYFALKKGNVALKNELEAVMRQIESSDSVVQERLFNKYFSNIEYKFGLNQEEKAFVAENQTWRAVIDDEVAPLFYLENGVESGVAVSFLNKIAKETGVKIEYVKRDKKISLSEQMKRDKIQIVVGRSTSDIEEKTENLILTTPFVDGNFSLVSTKDFNLDKREGKICATQNYTKLLKTEKPSKIVRTDTVDDVIELILSGKADYGIVSACSIQFALNNGFYPNIRFVSMADNHVSATYAVSKDADLTIVSIINKAILAYAAEDVPMFLNERMVNSTRKLSIKNLIVMYPFETFAFCIVVTACIFMYIVFWIRRKNKIEKDELETKEKVYREKLLSAISNNIDTVILIFDEKSNKMEYVFENSYRVIGIKNSSILKNPEKYYKMQPTIFKELVESKKINESKHHSFLIETLNPITNKNITLKIAIIPFELDNNMKYIITVDDATEELKNKENLQKALADSIIANTAKSRFLSNMSHEMRTPLSAIIGMTEIVNEKIKSNEPLEDSVEKIDSSARYMLQLVNDVLDMSKISEGKITIKKEVFNMREMLNFVADLYQVIAKEKNVTLISDFSDNIPELVVSDQVKIKQVFVNLLSNAVKYNKQNGMVECSVRCLNKNENAATLRFEIKDNGVGIKPENLAKIFTPFEREERASEEIVKGTGLGLPIAKNIVDALGGELEVRSEFNVGSEFSFEITLELPKAGNENPTQDFEEKDDYDFSNKSFLVVEDSNINAIIIERMLKMRNAKVDVAENGKVGCDKFSSSEVGTYSAIIMDLRMPIMDGYEATKAIRAMERADAKTVKIIALSADAYVENMEIAIQAGMNTYCTKPIEKEKLFKALQD